MAATDARPVPRKAVAYRHYFAIRTSAGSLATTWDGQDSEVSLDGAAFADCTNEATEIGTTGIGYIDLTAAEMTADCVVLKVSVTTTGAIPYVVTLFPEEAGDLRAALTEDSRGEVADTLLDTTLTTHTNPDTPGYALNQALNLPNNPAAVGSAMTLAANQDVRNVTGNVTGSVGSVTGNLGGNVAGSVGSVTAAVTAGTVSDKTGYSLSAAGVQAIWDALSSTLTTAGSIGKRLVDYVTGDTYARLGAPAGASIAADIAGVTAPTAAAVADAVWDEVLSGHATAGSAGAALSTAQSAGDPWATAVPGAYGAGTAGDALGNIPGIKAKTDTIGASTITWTSPMSATGDATIFGGMTTTLSWTVSNYAGASLAGNTSTLKLQNLRDYIKSPSDLTADYSFTATVAQDGTTLTITAALTDENTGSIDPGEYKYQIVSVVGESKYIPQTGVLTVTKVLTSA